MTVSTHEDEHNKAFNERDDNGKGLDDGQDDVSDIKCRELTTTERKAGRIASLHTPDPEVHDHHGETHINEKAADLRTRRSVKHAYIGVTGRKAT